MRNILLTVICTCALFIPSSAAQPVEKDEDAIRAIIAGLATAWTNADASGFSTAFAENADFTILSGLRVRGKDAITEGHERIFRTIFKDTKMRLKVTGIRFIRQDVAIVLTDSAVVKKTEDFPAEPHNVQTFVMSRNNGKWEIVAFQNTQIQRRP